jgi:hypothetical protein
MTSRCIATNSPGNMPTGILAGMLGSRIRRGIPEGYAMGMRRAKLTFPFNIAEDQHSILQPISAWTAKEIGNVNLVLLLEVLWDNLSNKTIPDPWLWITIFVTMQRCPIVAHVNQKIASFGNSDFEGDRQEGNFKHNGCNWVENGDLGGISSRS